MVQHNQPQETSYQPWPITNLLQEHRRPSQQSKTVQWKSIQLKGQAKIINQNHVTILKHHTCHNTTKYHSRTRHYTYIHQGWCLGLVLISHEQHPVIRVRFLQQPWSCHQAAAACKKPVSSMEHLVGTHPRQEEICLQQSINRINIHKWIQHVWIMQKNQLTTRVKAMNHSQDYKWVRAYLTLWQYWSNQTNIVAKHSSNLIPWQIISKPLHLTNQVHEPKTNIYKQPHKCKVIETYHTKISTTLHQTCSTHNTFLTQSHLPCYTLLQCQTCTSLKPEARTNQWINDAGQVQAHILSVHTMRCTSTWI